MLRSITGVVPNVELTNLIQVYKQHMMWLAGYSGLQNSLVSTTSLNALLPTATKPIFQSFSAASASGLPFGSLNFPSQNLSSSAASSNNYMSSSDNDFPKNATSNTSPVAMQNETKMTVANMMQKYQQLQAANKMLTQQPELLSNNASVPGNATFSSNVGSTFLMVFNQ